ncbi:hypothetical protein Tco_0235143 [Tanacetum coccineum]
MNLRYLEEKPNVQGLVMNGTQKASPNPAGTQDANPDSECDERVIIELARLKGEVQRATSDAKDAEKLQERASTKTVPPGSIPVPTGCIQILSGGTMISPGGVPVPTRSPNHSFFDDEPTTRFPSPSDLDNNEP